MPDRRIVSAAPLDEEAQFEAGLRPRRLAEFTGQAKLKENLAIAIAAARQRGEAMDHVLLYGPPGLGKTTLAAIIAEELGVEFQQTSGPILQKKLDLTGILSNIRARQVFFIDEVHRLLPDVEEMLYSAIEDFRVDILIGSGPGARTHSIAIPKFTAIGATTRQGLVSGPLRSRFGLVMRLNHYTVEELDEIVKRSARLLSVEIDGDGAREIARRGRGTPRIANRLLRRVRDYAQVRADGHITRAVAETALDLLEVDRFGLDEIDQKIMLTVLRNYSGGPVGLNTISASIGEEPETIEEVYEPYLLQLGFLQRTPRGRIATDSAFDYFKVERRMRTGEQPALF
ncbi:MAG TPA: Holliday junction branch migration DNA helicase RuvB [Bryobacteraceae bacterium]|nr:Holliday junction branch migration DNA helicase RuvB [Bryobacteraceae bacterium]